MIEPSARHRIEGSPPWLRRHRMVWIAPAHHARVAAEIPDRPLRGIVANGLAAGWPVVVRQQTREDIRLGVQDEIAFDMLAVGMPLPPAQGKGRVALSVAREWIARTAPPPLLAAAIPHLPEPRRAGLLRLEQRANAIGLALRVYGSVAWEALTGCRYLTPESDVDLLWQPTTVRQLRAAIAMLSAWESNSGIRADGEILFGDDDAVAWREWARGESACVGHECGTAATRVLVKALSGPRLEEREKVLACLPCSEISSCAVVCGDMAGA